MNKFLMLNVLSLSISFGANAAPQDYWPSTVQYFIVAEQLGERDLRLAENLMSETDFSVYDLSYSDSFMRDLEGLVPDSVVKKGEVAVGNYIKNNLLGVIKDKTPQVAVSRVGQALAKTYKLEYLPAVVFDGQYIVYGKTVAEAVRSYQWERDKNAQK